MYYYGRSGYVHSRISHRLPSRGTWQKGRSERARWTQVRRSGRPGVLRRYWGDRVCGLVELPGVDSLERPEIAGTALYVSRLAR